MTVNKQQPQKIMKKKTINSDNKYLNTKVIEMKCQLNAWLGYIELINMQLVNGVSKISHWANGITMSI